MELTLFALYAVGAGIACIAFFLLFNARRKAASASVLLGEAREKLKHVRKDIETEKRESLIRVKDEIYRKRNEFELEVKRDRIEVERLQNKLNIKYESIEKKEQNVDELRRELQQ